MMVWLAWMAIAEEDSNHLFFEISSVGMLFLDGCEFIRLNAVGCWLEVFERQGRVGRGMVCDGRGGIMVIGVWCDMMGGGEVGGVSGI